MAEEVRPWAQLTDATNKYHGELENFVAKTGWSQK